MDTALLSKLYELRLTLSPSAARQGPQICRSSYRLKASLPEEEAANDAHGVGMTMHAGNDVPCASWSQSVARPEAAALAWRE